MGIFSSKKKHYVDTQVARLIEDEGIPDSALNAVIEALFKDKNITNALLDRSLHNGTKQFESYYRYAKKAGGYHYGLPNIFLHTSEDGNPAAAAQIAIEVGSPVTIQYMYFRPLNNVHAGLKHLTENLGFNHSTGEITGLYSNNSTQVYLEKMVAVHETTPGQEPEANSIGAMDATASNSPTPDSPAWAVPANLASIAVQSDVRIGVTEVESVEIHTVWRTFDAAGNQALDASNNPIYGRAVIVLNLTSYDTDKEYYQAKYTVDATNVVAYWIYDTATGTNTALNETFSAPNVVNPGTYFPFVVFRSEGTNRGNVALNTTPEHITTTKLLDKLGIDFQAVADAMHEDTDINNIDQAVLLMGVPITATDPIDIDYLYRYFESIHSLLPPSSKLKYTPVASLGAGSFGSYAGVNADYSFTLTDADFEVRFTFSSITFRYMAGTIGTGVIGEVTNTLTAITEIDAEAFNGSRTIPAGVENGSKRYIRKQINEHVYGEIILVNPRARYVIYRNMGAEAGLKDERLLIPLEHGICQQMSPFDREKLYHRSVHFVYNSHVVQVIKWYQRGAFKILLTIIAIVLIVTTGFGAELLVAVQGGLTAVALFILEAVILGIILPGMVFEFLFTELVKLIGIDAAAILAVVVFVLTGREIFKNGIVLTSTAETLLFAANGLVKGITESIQSDITELFTEVEDFKVFAEGVQEEIDEANALLNADIGIDPYVFVGMQPLTVMGESPSSYFDRTIHIGNIGTESLKIIENYCNISLTLPSDTEIAEYAYDRI